MILSTAPLCIFLCFCIHILTVSLTREIIVAVVFNLEEGEFSLSIIQHYIHRNKLCIFVWTTFILRNECLLSLIVI